LFKSSAKSTSDLFQRKAFVGTASAVPFSSLSCSRQTCPQWAAS
jgi:hypothetical protein